MSSPVTDAIAKRLTNLHTGHDLLDGYVEDANSVPDTRRLYTELWDAYDDDPSDPGFYIRGGSA